MNLDPDDRLAVAELLIRADDAATRRDVDGYVALFTEDGVLDGEKGAHQGHSALKEAVAEVWAAEGQKSAHLTLNAVIESTDDGPDRAVATSTLLIVHPGPPPALAAMASVTQHLRKTGDGWRIARRTVGGP